MRLTHLNKIFSFSLFTISLFFKICSAQEPLPFQGETNANNINIRADSTINAQIICTVNRGEQVDVISEFYEWYKIRLPKLAPVYIKKSMVECINQCENAKVLKNRVNVRLRPIESSPILGKVDKNEIIKILEGKGEWYRIEPIQNSFGWINKRFVNKISAIKKVEKETGAISIQEENITLFGIIKPYGKIFKRVATHKLITCDNQTFLLKGDKKNLDALNYHKVKVMGKIISSPGKKYPVVKINMLEIIN